MPQSILAGNVWKRFMEEQMSSLPLVFLSLLYIHRHFKHQALILPTDKEHLRFKILTVSPSWVMYSEEELERELKEEILRDKGCGRSRVNFTKNDTTVRKTTGYFC